MCVCLSYLDRRYMCVWCVAMYCLHGGKVLVTHMKHLSTFPWSQMCWTVLQGGRLLILVPVLLQKRTHKQGCWFQQDSCIRSSYWLSILKIDYVKITKGIIVHGCLLSLKLGMLLMTHFPEWEVKLRLTDPSKSNHLIPLGTSL